MFASEHFSAGILGTELTGQEASITCLGRSHRSRNLILEDDIVLLGLELRPEGHILGKQLAGSVSLSVCAETCNSTREAHIALQIPNGDTDQFCKDILRIELF